MIGEIVTPQYPWETLRALGAEDGAAAISLTSGDTYHQQKANCVDLHSLFGEKFAGIIIIMYGGTVSAQSAANNDAFGFDLVGYRAPKGSLSQSSVNPAILICSCAATAAIVGTMEMSPDGGTTKTSKWVDSMTLTNNDWPGTLNKFDHDNNRVCQLAFDACGVRFLRPWVHGADGGQAGESPGVGMLISAY